MRFITFEFLVAPNFQYWTLPSQRVDCYIDIDAIKKIS